MVINYEIYIVLLVTFSAIGFVYLWKWYFFKRNSNIDDIYLNLIRSKLIEIYPEIKDKLILKTGYASFTRNKEIIYLCIYDPETGRRYDEQDLIYVALHELAHLLCTSYSIDSHNEEFIEKFTMLRKRAHDLNILNYEYSVKNIHCSVT